MLHWTVIPGIVRILPAVLLTVLPAAGCLHTPLQNVVSRPARHSVQTDYLLVLSDNPLSADHPLLRELEVVREQVRETLRLPGQRDRVVVYLFNNEAEYGQYLQTVWPALPPRRAYFVGTPGELAVYSFWGDRILEDLRHEYTHGLLHACLSEVPLWLDEGLAEYFEIPGSVPGDVNREYTVRLGEVISHGWAPDLDRLESFEEFSNMQRMDYQEAWAWVHFMLHSNPDSAQILYEFLQELRNGPAKPVLSERLRGEYVNLNHRFLNYVASLNTVPGLAMEQDLVPNTVPERESARAVPKKGSGVFFN